MTNEIPEASPNTRKVYRRLRRRRSSHARRVPLPDALWAAAGELAREHGINRAAKALDLEYGKLKERAEALGQEKEVVRKVRSAVPRHTESTAAPTFMELITPRSDRLAGATARQGLWLRSMFEVVWALGWRRAEIRQRKVKDVDFLGGPKGQGTIRLPDSKSGDPRIVTLPKRLRDLLVECCKGKGSEDFLITRDGKAVVDYRDAWAAALKEAKI